MVEVFKTNVDCEHLAIKIVNVLYGKFHCHKVNFDLEDCDNILRIESNNGTLKVTELLQFLREFDFIAEVLPE